MARAVGPRAPRPVGGRRPRRRRRRRLPGGARAPSTPCRWSSASPGSTTTRRPDWPTGWVPDRGPAGTRDSVDPSPCAWRPTPRPTWPQAGPAWPWSSAARRSPPSATTPTPRGPIRPGRAAAVPPDAGPGRGRPRDLPGLPDLRPPGHGPAGPPRTRPSPTTAGSSGELLAPLSEVAAADPDNAWFPVARTAEEIVRPEPANRMVATPYTKLMTAVMDVDMAAAVLMATEARADELGVPVDRRVYLWGAGVGEEPPTMAARPDLWRSPAMASAARCALGGRRDRRGGPPRPVLVLLRVAPVRPRRPGHHRRPPPDRHRWPPLPRRPGQQLRHPRRWWPWPRRCAPIRVPAGW